MVETDEDVGDDEAALRQIASGFGQLHARFEARDVVVREVADNGLVRSDSASSTSTRRVP